MKSTQWLLGGLLGGLFGGLIALIFFFTAPFVEALIPSLNVVVPLSKIAHLVDILVGTGTHIIWGYVGHLVVSLTYGLIFGMFCTVAKPKNWKITLLYGFGFTLFYTCIGPFLFMPLILDKPEYILHFSPTPFVLLELSIHLTFTISMSLVMGYRIHHSNSLS